jgi:hypothetical protein
MARYSTGRVPVEVYDVPPLPDHEGDDFRDLRDSHEFSGLVHPNPTENEHGPVGPDNPTLPF